MPISLNFQPEWSFDSERQQSCERSGPELRQLDSQVSSNRDRPGADRAAPNSASCSRGAVDRVGGEAIITLQAEHGAKHRSAAPMREVRVAVDYILRWVTSEGSGIGEVRSVADLHAVGHRVVHGGERFTHSVLITDDYSAGSRMALSWPRCTIRAT